MDEEPGGMEERLTEEEAGGRHRASSVESATDDAEASVAVKYPSGSFLSLVQS